MIADKPSMFVVILTCCGREDGVFGPVPWAEADAFRESYCAGPGVSDRGGHERAGIIEAAPGAFWPVPVHRYPRSP